MWYSRWGGCPGGLGSAGGGNAAVLGGGRSVGAGAPPWGEGRVGFRAFGGRVRGGWGGSGRGGWGGGGGGRTPARGGDAPRHAGGGGAARHRRNLSGTMMSTCLPLRTWSRHGP